MKIKLVECLEWRAPNKPGQLLRYADAFKKANVDLDILWSCGSSQDVGACAKQPAKLRSALKAAGVKASASKCFLIAGQDKTGAIVGVLGKLASAKINVECFTAMAAQGTFGSMLWVKDRDIAKARRLLKA